MWTDNGAKAFQVAGKLRAGVVWQNTYNKFDPTAAFGGYKESGFGREGGPSGLLPYLKVGAEPPLARRQDVQALLGGAFVRSESGRSDRDRQPAPTRQRPARLAQGRPRRRQGRARGAGGWAKRTAYNRGQVLYRFAEALESRSDELARAASRSAIASGRDELGAAVDLLVHYAGWTDKLAAVMGGINPVAAPYCRSPPPSRPASSPCSRRTSPTCSGLVREIAPVLAAGNTAVAIVSRRWPLRALDLGEVAGVSDVPGGVLNLLSRPARRAAHAALRPPRRQRDRRRDRRPGAGGDDRRARRRDGQARLAAVAGRRPVVAPGGGDGAQDGLAPRRKS